MSEPRRENKQGVRLSDEELWYLKEFCRRNGIDASGVLRQALLKWAREEGLVYPGPEKKKNHPKH